MFGDFIALGFDQIVNGISKFREMYDDQVTVPLVVRTPMGGAPRLRPDAQPVAREAAARRARTSASSRRASATTCGALLVDAVEDDDPVFFIENKLMYGRPNRRPEGGHVDELARAARPTAPYPALTFSGSDFAGGSATIVTYGGMLPIALEAATELILEHELFCEVVALSQLLPLDLDPVLESVARTGALVTVEEGTLTGGVGAEIAARVQEAALGELRRPVRRVAARRRGDPVRARASRTRRCPACTTSSMRSRPSPACEAERPRMLEIILTREDANTEFALLTEWLVGRRSDGRQARRRLRGRDHEGLARGRGAGSGNARAPVRRGRRGRAGGAHRADRREPGRARAGACGAPSAARPADAAGPTSRKATRKAVELAEQHGIDLDSIEKQGFITERDVEALLVAQAVEEPGGGPSLLAGISLEGVTLPASFTADESVGDASTRPSSPRSRPIRSASARCPSDEKVAAYREAGAAIGEGVVLGEGTLVVAPRIVLDEGVSLGPGGTVRCDDVVAIGALTTFGANLELACRRAYLGAGIWGGRGIRFGGGGHRDPWAILTVGDLGFVGDEAFVNVCRPVLIGREVFLTMRSIVVTHNVGHSVLEGFENRFAPVVLEDRSQVGMGTVVYAGCRVGAGAIVGVELVRRLEHPAGEARDRRPRARSRATPAMRRRARARSISLGGSSRTSTSCSACVATPSRRSSRTTGSRSRCSRARAAAAWPSGSASATLRRSPPPSTRPSC